jgi:hypothetical protein
MSRDERDAFTDTPSDDVKEAAERPPVRTVLAYPLSKVTRKSYGKPNKSIK